ncbi:MAG: VOC family protein [Anaerolineae bacterium]
MVKIRHIAYRAADVEAMASFFVNAFGMKLIRRRHQGGIDLSDGTINLAVVPLKTTGPWPAQQGADHIGFMVEDEEEAVGHLEAAGARKIGSTVDPYQLKFQGPEGIVVEIGDWPGAERTNKVVE